MSGALGLGPYLADGRLRVDPAATSACARELERSFAACSATRDDVAQICAGMLVAATPIGAGCLVSDALCAGGTGSCASGECACLVLPSRAGRARSCSGNRTERSGRVRVHDRYS